jgi:hypothetical protein
MVVRWTSTMVSWFVWGSVFFFFQKKKQKALFRFAEGLLYVLVTVKAELGAIFSHHFLLFPEEAKSIRTLPIARRNRPRVTGSIPPISLFVDKNSFTEKSMKSVPKM